MQTWCDSFRSLCAPDFELLQNLFGSILIVYIDHLLDCVHGNWNLPPFLTLVSELTDGRSLLQYLESFPQGEADSSFCFLCTQYTNSVFADWRRTLMSVSTCYQFGVSTLNLVATSWRTSDIFYWSKACCCWCPAVPSAFDLLLDAALAALLLCSPSWRCWLGQCAVESSQLWPQTVLFWTKLSQGRLREQGRDLAVAALIPICAIFSYLALS